MVVWGDDFKVGSGRGATASSFSHRINFANHEEKNFFWSEEASWIPTITTTNHTFILRTIFYSTTVWLRVAIVSHVGGCWCIYINIFLHKYHYHPRDKSSSLGGLASYRWEYNLFLILRGILAYPVGKSSCPCVSAVVIRLNTWHNKWSFHLKHEGNETQSCDILDWTLWFVYCFY